MRFLAADPENLDDLEYAEESESILSNLGLLSKPPKHLRVPKLPRYAARCFDLKGSQTNSGVRVGTSLQASAGG